MNALVTVIFAIVFFGFILLSIALHEIVEDKLEMKRRSA